MVRGSQTLASFTDAVKTWTPFPKPHYKENDTVMHK